MKRGVVFDMDKCIGYFTQIAMYQDIIEELTRPLKVNEYFDLFNMFPEIFRPGIFNVFRYLAKEKKKGRLKVIIYTNNNGPPSWAANIRKYIEYKIKKKLFDRTIKGWKYDKKIVEKNRSGYAKTWKDLLDCTQLNKHDRVIFFDDRDEHDGMRHKNVDYQEVKPYKTDITHEVFVKRFMRSKLKNKLGYIEESVLKNICERSGHKPKMTSMKYSNNDIMKPLREFLKSTKKTRKQRRFKKKKTRKGGGSTNHRANVLTRKQLWRGVLNPTPRDAERRQRRQRMEAERRQRRQRMEAERRQRMEAERQQRHQRHQRHRRMVTNLYNNLNRLAPQSASEFRRVWYATEQNNVLHLGELESDLRNRIAAARIAAAQDAIGQADIAAID